MIIGISIFDGIKTVINEKNRDTLSDFFFSSKSQIYNDITITAAKDTVDENYSSLVDIFGDDFENYLTLVPSVKMKKYGNIRVSTTDMRRKGQGERFHKTLNLEVFTKVAEYNLEPLKKEIATVDPEYLIVDLATWEQIMKEDPDKVDKYSNGSAYYHSYCKVPVAICEMVDPNEVKLVVN